MNIEQEKAIIVGKEVASPSKDIILCTQKKGAYPVSRTLISESFLPSVSVFAGLYACPTTSIGGSWDMALK